MPFVPDQQPQEKESKLKSLWNTAKDVTSRAFYGPSQMGGGGIEATKQVTDDTYKAPEIGSFKIPNIHGGQATVNTGELINPAFVGMYRGLKDKKSVMEELPKALNVDPDSGKGMAIGMAGELMTPDIADVAFATKPGKALLKYGGNKFTKLFGKGGEALAEQGVKPTKTQRVNFFEATKKTIGKYISDNKLAGDVANKVVERIDDLQSSFDDIAMNSGKKITAEDLQVGFQKSIENLDPIIDKSEIKALKEFTEDLVSSNTDGIFDIGELTKMRKRLDAKIPKAQWQKLLGGEAVNKMVETRQALQALIREAAGDLTSPDGKTLKELGTELNHSYKLKDIVGLQEGISVGGRLGGLGDIAATGTGFATGGVPGAIKSFIGRRVISNPKVQGKAAQLLLKTEEELAKPGLIRSFAKKSIPVIKETLMNPFRPEEKQQTKQSGPTSGFIPD